MFFFNDPATTDIFTLSLHDALPISDVHRRGLHQLHDRSVGDGPALEPGAAFGDRRARSPPHPPVAGDQRRRRDRKSTRLNSSHANISYAVFCLKKKYTYDK